MYKYLTYLLILIISMNGYTDFKNLGPDDVLTTPLPLPYDEKVVDSLQLDEFIDLSISKGKQPVVIFGGNWCPDCRILDGTLKMPSIESFMSEHFEIMHIDVGRYDKNMELMDYFGVAREKGVPRVIVFDKEMNILNSSSTKEWTTVRDRKMQDVFDYFQELVK